ncbi:hypothetical protein ACFY5D_04450 [Paeniglutamicibacter sp. NPDC012692]|uniref:hypothetical protein n=1 Tax=Paeniglutamicibacter sp. NPDC012692 TaxID=3364388 RepID=UPI00369ED6E8
MSKQIVTITSAEVPVERAGAVVSVYQAILAQDVPDGFLNTRLVHDGQDRRAIRTRRRGEAAIDAVRAGPRAPAARSLGRTPGTAPTLAILIVEAAST